ncbi:MAG: Fe-S oxidoreductase, partial [Acidobacteria bacterium]|nr:Fe-S oxidoreductase [Acidobacteriota bacterium]
MSFGTAVITPRWLFVLAGATPAAESDLRLVDETIERCDPGTFQPGDVVGIGIHTANALRGYEVGRAARDRGAWVVFGGIHSSLYPEEALELGGAHAVVRGDGDAVWPKVLEDCAAGRPARVYEGGKVAGSGFVAARWSLLPRDHYMWASVQTLRGCPKHCSFCSVWRTDGQEPRSCPPDAVVQEVVELRRMGFRFIAFADDNFYPVTLKDLAVAARNGNAQRLAELTAVREERFELMRKLAQLPNDLICFTQITMEAAEDPEFLAAMKRAHIVGALVGVESVTPEGLKSVYKDFNLAGEALTERLRAFRAQGIHVLGSFIFGLPTDRDDTFDATLDMALRSDVTFAQFVTLTPLPGTVDFARWQASIAGREPRVAGVPVTQHWLIPPEHRPKTYTPHPTMSAEE